MPYSSSHPNPKSLPLFHRTLYGQLSPCHVLGNKFHYLAGNSSPLEPSAGSTKSTITSPLNPLEKTSATNSPTKTKSMISLHRILPVQISRNASYGFRRAISSPSTRAVHWNNDCDDIRLGAKDLAGEVS